MILSELKEEINALKASNGRIAESIDSLKGVLGAILFALGNLFTHLNAPIFYELTLILP